jgi:hypothetical protein
MMESGFLQSHARIALAAVAAMLLASSLVPLAPRLHKVFKRSYMIRTIMFFVVTRFGLMLVLIMIVGHLVGPDQITWSLHGGSALKGLLPYVDYRSEYGPFFSYLLAPAFTVFDSDMAPIIVFVFFDFLTFIVLRHATQDSDLNHRAATLYLVTPISWFMVVRYGQDETIGAFLLVLMLVLDRMNRRGLLPLVAGLGASATKILLMLPALPIVVGRTRRLRGLVIAGGVVVICYLPFYLMGGDIFQWKPDSQHYGGPNLWAALEVPLGRYYGHASLVASSLLLALIGVVIWRVRNVGCVNSILVLYSAMMIVSPKAWPAYALLVLPFICLKVTALGRRRDLALLSVYSFTLLLFCQIGPPAWARGQPAKWLVSECCTLFILGYNLLLLWTSGVRASGSVGPGGRLGVIGAEEQPPGSTHVEGFRPVAGGI